MTLGSSNGANTHARCFEGLLMTTIEDAAPFVTLIQCIHRMHWSIYGAKTSAPRRPHRPQISPFMTLGPSNGANTHAR